MAMYPYLILNVSITVTSKAVTVCRITFTVNDNGDVRSEYNRLHTIFNIGASEFFNVLIF